MYEIYFIFKNIAYYMFLPRILNCQHARIYIQRIRSVSPLENIDLFC